MTRFNKNARTQHTETMLAGGQGFKMTPEMKLYSIVCASMLSKTFYIPDTNGQINKIKTLIRKVNPLFVAQLAVYAREQMYLRSIPMVLTVELAKCHKGDNLLRLLSRRVIQRADEITEMLSYYVKANKLQAKFVKAKGGHNVEKKVYKLSAQLRKGIADAFGKFDEYQFAKYNSGNEIKLRDAMFLTHPKPSNKDQEVLFQKIAQNTLSIPYTWETQMSKGGSEGKDKKTVWEELINSNKMGYMAMLKNLRNFLNTGVSEECMIKVANRIADPNQVRKSKQFPFRFLTAYRSIAGDVRLTRLWSSDYQPPQANESKYTEIVKDCLEKAVRVSVENITSLNNKRVLIAADVSGSMQTPISEKSVLQHFDIGILLGLLLQSKSPNNVFGIFGNTWKPLTNETVRNVLAGTNQIHNREGEVGYGTHGYLVLDWAIKNKVVFDKVMYFTDGQMYGHSNDLRTNDLRTVNEKWNEYINKVNKNAQLILFNLNSYGQSAFDLRSNNISMVTGWNDKIFKIMESMEKGQDALSEIKEIRL